MPRRSDFTQELADLICDRIASGESLRKICDDDDMPAVRTVHNWLNDPARVTFVHQYARARQMCLQVYEDEIIEIGDHADTYVDERGNERIDPGDVQRRKLKADNLKWIMSKLAPKKYGDKLELGGDDKSPLTVIHRIERAIVDPKEPTEG